jgi:hypothetical protein
MGCQDARSTGAAACAAELPPPARLSALLRSIESKSCRTYCRRSGAFRAEHVYLIHDGFQRHGQEVEAVRVELGAVPGRGVAELLEHVGEHLWNGGILLAQCPDARLRVRAFDLLVCEQRLDGPLRACRPSCEEVVLGASVGLGQQVTEHGGYSGVECQERG